MGVEEAPWTAAVKPTGAVATGQESMVCRTPRAALTSCNISRRRSSYRRSESRGGGI
jgi:hypothetical protein